MENKKNYSRFLTFSIFISFLFIFGFILSVQPIKAACGDACPTSGGCYGVVDCVTNTCKTVGECCGDGVCGANEKSSGTCSADCGGGSGSGAKCGDKVCNGNETPATCPADCGSNTCVPKCKDKSCGAQDGCGKFCFGRCEDKTKVCDPSNWKCIKPSGCKDTDMTADDPYLVKGTATAKNGQQFADHCLDSNRLMEYWCEHDGTVGGDDSYVCPVACKDGACVECKQDSDCADSPKGKFCDQSKGVCAKACKPKTCKDYPGQCGAVMDNGCGFYINCINNCSGAKPYCDDDRKCTKQPAKNCCIAIYDPLTEPEKKCEAIKKEKECNSVIDDDGGKACLWDDLVGYPPVKKCIPSVVLLPYHEMEKINPDCQRNLILPLKGDPNAQQEKENFFNNNNCGTQRYWYTYHGSKKDCQPLFGKMSKCISCDGKSCKLFGFKAAVCSIAQDSDEVIKGAKMLRQQLIDKNDYVTKIIITANQAVSSSCAPTPMTITVTAADEIGIEYFSCDKISEYNKTGKGGCATAAIFGQAQNEKVRCLDSDNQNKIAMCCPDKDSGWAWFYVDSADSECPNPTAFSNILRNTGGLLKPITDTLSNAVVVITSAISAAVVGTWWLISKFLLRK